MLRNVYTIIAVLIHLRLNREKEERDSNFIIQNNYHKLVC